MASSKFDNLWRFMSGHNLEIEGSPPEGVLCRLCSRLMIEPYAAECGCQFCGKCIKEYLESGVMKCPKEGEGGGCGDEELEIDVNVFKDVRTNQILKKVIVKCPTNKCGVCTELGKMEDHVKECIVRINCPFKALGCVSKEMIEDSLDDHMKGDNVSHSQLLVQSIKDMERKIEELMNIGDRREQEMREERDTYRKEINDQVKEISVLKEETNRNKENINRLEEDVHGKEILIKELREELNKLKKKMTTIIQENIKEYCEELKTSLEMMGISINELKDRERKKNESEEKVVKEEEISKKELDEYVSEIDRIDHSDVDSESKYRSEGKEEYEKVSCKSDSNDVNEDNVTINLKFDNLDWKTGKSKVCDVTQENDDFIWIMKDFSQKVTNAASYCSSLKLHYSDPFFKDDYKLCLCGRITELKELRNYLYLELYLVIMKGDHDDMVQWPMKHLIEISVKNQATSMKHKKGRYSYDSHNRSKVNFQKPNKEMNGGIGGLSISVKDITSLYGLLVNDAVMVCVSLYRLPS